MFKKTCLRCQGLIWLNFFNTLILQYYVPKYYKMKLRIEFNFNLLRGFGDENNLMSNHKPK